ncbi:MAG TPA: pseudouridine-5'-phosphate glycosidase [Anaerolineales bacterium]|nr:pseudouridine-5'-phosphate glycosidase [Anaerolineales bacterium]
MSFYLNISPEVQTALRQKKAVVALESTVISHGLPYPQNLELAQKMEQTVRENGAVPATIAILAGKLCVGLSEEQIQQLATAQDVVKVSRRDIGWVLASKRAGATTVASTMLIAHWAGIGVFATGGIGGVHRGTHWDISADLPELAQTPVTVVCAGAKAILDLPATMEWLETHGVPVVGYGTDELPAFYSRSSGLKLQIRAEDALEVAEIVRTQRKLGLPAGTLVTVPVPATDALPVERMDAIIEAAVQLANAQGVVGKDVTPFLLSHIATATAGESIRANVALLLNNAATAAKIAIALETPQKLDNPRNWGLVV